MSNTRFSKEIWEDLERLYKQSNFTFPLLVYWIWIQNFVGYESKFCLHLFVIYESKFYMSSYVEYESKFYLFLLFLWFYVFFCVSSLISPSVIVLCWLYFYLSLIVLVLCLSLLLFLWCFLSKSELVTLIFFLDNIDHFHVDIGTLVFDCHIHFSPPMATPTPFETMDHLLSCSSQQLPSYDRGTFCFT